MESFKMKPRSFLFIKAKASLHYNVNVIVADL